MPTKSAKTRALLVLAATVFLTAAAASAGTITVNSTLQVTSPTGNGDSQCSLGEAIRAANTDSAVDGCAAGSGDDVIVLPAGTYTLAAVDFADETAGLPPILTNISIQGAGPATTIIERSLTAPAFRIFYLESPSLENTVTFELVGVTVRNGIATGSFSTGSGGAVHNQISEFLCADCVFQNNSAEDSGGAIYLDVGNLTVNNSVFVNNSAGEDGGAVYVSCSPSQISDSTFFLNVAAGDSGGALNQATGCAGFGGTTIERSVFASNTAGVDGGAIVLSDDPSSIRQSIFQFNTADRFGGAIASFFELLEVDDSTFQANQAGVSGGALVVEPAVIRNSTFMGNIAGDEGGAMAFFFDSVTLSNVTITGNSVAPTASEGGGGIVDYSVEPSIIRNSIIAGNTAEIGPDCYAFDLLVSEGHNIFGDATDCGFTSGTGDIIGSAASPVEPMLQALGPNGGKTAGANLADAGFVPQIIGTRALLAGSPAIDAGDPAAPGTGGTACEANDQRGAARPDGPTCDMGAFEGVHSLGTESDLVLLPLQAPVAAGDQMVYAAQVRNDGPATATSVVLTDNLSGQVAALSASGSQGGACAVSARFVSCPLGTLASGATATVAVTTSILGSGWGSQKFSASADQSDPDPGNNLRAIELGENRPPTAVVSAPDVIAATSRNGALVTLDGGASSDPDGDSLTYRWSGPFPEGSGVVMGRNPQVTLPLGESRVTLVVNDGANDSPPAEVTVTVSGFSLNVAPSVSLAAGRSAELLVTLSPQHGPFERDVQLSCADVPAFLSCSFSPAAVTPNGSSATAVLTLRASAMAARQTELRYFAAWMFGVPLVGLLFAGKRRVRIWMLGAVAAVLLFLAGCGGSVASDPPALTVRVHVTGTSGQLTHSSAVTVNVQR